MNLHMKKSCLLLALGLTLTISSFAQNRLRVFDNFDTSRGVQIVTPTVAPLVSSLRNKRQTQPSYIKKTVSTMNVRDGLALKDASNGAPYNKLTMGTAVGMKGFTTGDARYDSFIVDSSRRYNVDPLLIYSQMHQESSFKLRATSNKGASGLMQLMPGTARRFGVTDIYDPKQNIDAGVKYMRWLLDTFNQDVVLALAGYNAGEGAVMKYGYQVPPYRETQEYVRRITGRYNEISNPGYVQSVRRVSATQAARLESKVSAPLTVYEPNAVAIRLPDGRMRLVNQ
jgi:Transglycosylase SLT domain